jgi:LPPG:FO 2-phospho-L-lactate transferase
MGGETWFKLGDKDMATHLRRTERLRQGASLLEVTAELADQLGVTARVHPMTEHAVRTTVHCDGQDLAFQHYFVREACQPAVSGFSFEGIEQALPNPQVMSLLKTDSFGAVIVCPSNPFVSIDPILGLSGLWQALSECSARVALVSPIVGGMAIKGPAAKMMAELGLPVTTLGVAEHYAANYPGLIDHFVIDESDAKLGGEIAKLGMRVSIAPTVMKSRQDKRQLALHVLSLIRS